MLKRHLVSLLLSFIIAGCVSEPQTQPEPQANLQPTMTAVSSMQSGYQIPAGSRIGWLEDGRNFQEQGLSNVSGLQPLIEQAIVSELKAKGLRFEASSPPYDYLVAYVAALEEALSDEMLLRRYGIMPGTSLVQSEPDVIEKGTLIIYLVEADSKRLIWRSALQSAVHRDVDEKTRRERVNYAVHTMFVNLPVQ